MFDVEWPELALEALESGMVIDLGYDACYIDDGQDFADLWFSVIEGLANEPREIVVTVDEAQNLYGREPTFFPRSRAPRGHWTTYPLLKTPRLSGQTRSAATALRDQMQLELPQAEHPDHEPTDLQSGHSRLWNVSSRAEAGAKAIALVQSSLEQGTQPSDVAVLVPTRQVGAAITGLLSELGIDANHIFPAVPQTQEGGQAARQPSRARGGDLLTQEGVRVGRPSCEGRDAPLLQGVGSAQGHLHHAWAPGTQGDHLCVRRHDPLKSGPACHHHQRCGRAPGTDADPRTRRPIDGRLVQRFQRLFEAADGLSQPFRRTPVTEDPGIEWRGYDVLPAPAP